MRHIPLVFIALASCSRPGTSDVQAVRLTGAEYNRTVRDLFGYADAESWPEPEGDWDEDDGGVWPFVFPDELGVEGFSGVVEGQVASPYYVEQTQRAAQHFAPFALQGPFFWTCDPDAAADLVSCAEESVVRFAHRAWRGPLDDAERARLTAFHAANVAEHGALDGSRYTVEGILMAPRFLFRSELGDAQGELSSWEMASRMSYFLWDSMPDEELFAAASADKLRTSSQIRSQARRMVRDPRAREMVVDFHMEWLEIDAVFSARPDQATYAGRLLDLSAAEEDYEDQDFEEYWSSAFIGLRRGMVTEAELFVEKTVFEGGGTLADLLTDHHGFVTTVEGGFFEGQAPTTATLYRPTEVRDGQRVQYDVDDGNLEYRIRVDAATFPETERAGVLTLGAVLAARAHPVHPAPVLRGTFVLERIACQNIGQPPAEAAGATPADVPGTGSTNRERLEATTSSSFCMSCHDAINPAGLAFEHYDSLGGWRDDDEGRDIDATGDFRLMDDPALTPVDGAVSLAHHLAKMDVVHDCYVKHWSQVAFGRAEPNPAALSDLQRGFRGRGDVQSLLVDIVAHPSFRALGGVQ